MYVEKPNTEKMENQMLYRERHLEELYDMEYLFVLCIPALVSMNEVAKLA